MRRISSINIIYALHLIWTGLWASIDAQLFKAKAFGFCITLGIITLCGAYLHQTGKSKIATVVSATAAAITLVYYLQTFISDAANDANFRIGLIIVSSIAFLVITLFPSEVRHSN